MAGAVALLAAGLAGTAAASTVEDDSAELTMEAPDVAAGGTVTHRVTVRTTMAGDLDLRFTTEKGQRSWREEDRWVTGLSVAAVDGSTADCSYPSDVVEESLHCRLPEGTTTVAYTLKAAANTPAWKLTAHLVFSVGSDLLGSATSDFAVQSSVPVADDYLVLGRDKGTGALTMHGAYGVHGLDVERYFWRLNGWDKYNAFTKLSPIKEWFLGGGVVARDKEGVLWHYQMPGLDMNTPMRMEVRVGSGWNAYTLLRGAGDLNGDGQADLIARDGSGALWLYKGTGSWATPFAARVQIGTGWNIYTSLTGGIDVSGDGKPDLIARDSAGDLWLYQGTGDGSLPVKPRTKIGNGWNIYNSLVPLGDINADGHPELVARDAAGVMWMYMGTGDAALPFKARAQAARDWDRFDALT
jgi:FG-GAP-like repeat